jgi:hypothetical protein
MSQTWPAVMVTAHRRLPGGVVDEWLGAALRDCLRRLRDEHGLERGISGLATGGDHEFGLACRDLDIPLFAAIPYPNQPLDGTDGRPGPKWTKKDQAIWAELKDYARTTAGVHEVSADPRSPNERVGLLHKRNDWMLERAQQVLGLLDPASHRSGTGSCLRKAVKAGYSPILFHLIRRTVTRPLPHHWAIYLDNPALARVQPRTEEAIQP